MITLIASITGFLGSLMPYFLSLLREQSDKRHELAILDRQMALRQSGASERLPEIQPNLELEHAIALYKTYRTNIGWVDALNGTVRPVLAYSFFLLYAAVKLLQWECIMGSLPNVMVVELLWNVEDQAIFAGIISFYYGQRALHKLQGKQK